MGEGRERERGVGAAWVDGDARADDVPPVHPTCEPVSPRSGTHCRLISWTAPLRPTII